MEVWNPKHPHHAVWREYTQSLMDNKPKVVRCKVKDGDVWEKVSHPNWLEVCDYEIARPTLKLSYEVPMPVTEPLEMDQKYWYVSSDDGKPRACFWKNDHYDKRWLRSGLIYLTEADAQAAIDARNAAMTAALEDAK